MGPIVVYALILWACVAGLCRPFWGLAGYLFLLFLQPDWNWRWDGLYGLQYQKYVVGCILIGTSIQGFRGNRLSGWAGASILSLLGFICLIWLSSLQSLVPLASEVYFDVLWKTTVVAFLAYRLVDTPEKTVLLMWFIVLGSGYNAFRINEDYFTTGVARWINNSWGYKGDSNVYSLFTFPALTCSMVLVFTAKKMYLRGFASVIAILHVHQLMLLESRGALLGAALSSVLLITFVRKSLYTNIGIAVALIVVLVLAGPPVEKEFRSIFAKEGERDSSAESRFILWTAATKIAFDYPLLGVGPNATQFMIPKYAVEFSDLGAKHPHNFFLDIASGCGIPAFLCFVAFLMIPFGHILYFRKLYFDVSESCNTIILVPLITIPGFCVAGLFSGGGMIESIYLIIAIWTGGFLSMETQQSELKNVIETAEFQINAIQLPPE